MLTISSSAAVVDGSGRLESGRSDSALVVGAIHGRVLRELLLRVPSRATDWLDRFFGYLDRPSAEIPLSEFQHLAVGDVIPVGGSGAG
jgi:hypothetical protein